MENFIGRQAQLAFTQGTFSDVATQASAMNTKSAPSVSSMAATSLASCLPREAFFLSMKLVMRTVPETAPSILQAFSNAMASEHALAKLNQVIESGDFRRLPTAEALATDLNTFCKSDPITDKSIVFDTLSALTERISQLMGFPVVHPAIVLRAAEISQMLLETHVEMSNNSAHPAGQLTLGHVTPLLALLNRATSIPGLGMHLAPSRNYLLAKQAELQTIANIHAHGISATWDIPPELWHNRAVAATVFAVDGSALQNASEEFKRDPGMVIVAVQENGFALEYANPEVQDHFDVVLAAVQRNGGALEFASVRLQNDPRIALAAIEQNSRAFVFVGEEVRNIWLMF